LRWSRLFLRAEVNIAFEFAQANVALEMAAEKLNESVEAMNGRLVGGLNQRIIAFDRFNVRRAVIEGMQMGIVPPQIGVGGPDVG